MIKNYTPYKILRLFFDSPTKKFQLREICRLLKIGMPSVRLHVKRPEKEGFIDKKTDGIYPGYVAARNEKFRIYKRNDMLLRLHESGLVDFLVENFMPDAIVLFGSASWGEDVEGSDIDLFALAKPGVIDLKEYEKMLKRRINILFEKTIDDVPGELLNNIINGIVIYGYMKVLK